MFKREIIILAKTIRNSKVAKTAKMSLIRDICTNLYEADPLFNYKLFRKLASPDTKEEQ